MSKAICTFELFLQGQWHPVATLDVLAGLERGVESETLAAYLIDHVLLAQGRRDAYAVSAAHPVSLVFIRLPTWPAFAVDLLPQGYGRQELARRLDIPASNATSDWALLLAGAGNPIGNLRISEAVTYLKEHATTSSQGFSREDITSRSDSFMEYLATAGYFVAGSSGVQGEWPKILLTQDWSGRWHLDHLLPDDQAMSHWIVKFARAGDAVFRTILAVESSYYSIASKLGLKVGQSLTHENGVLFIPRFDRAVTDRGVARFGQESLYSLAGRAGFEVALTHNQAIATIAKHCTNPVPDIVEYILRDALNIALGNKDNHGRNTAFQRFDTGQISLAPLFDFAPMFLHPDGIARRMRWEGEVGGQPDWGVVVEQAAFAGNISADIVRQRMAEFAESMALLPHLLKDHNVPSEIIDRLHPGINSTTRGLAQAAQKGRY
ncbi:MAG: HipA domain-containing protein [Methylotenera sp.]|nr:HipA domain-containing protein [Methylotenera sp.]